MTTDRDQLREQLAATIWASGHGIRAPWREISQTTRDKYNLRADAVLAVPAIAAALTAVERVQALADREDPEHPYGPFVTASELRRALTPRLEPFGTWQEQSAAMPRPPRDDDYTPHAINRDQETT